MEKQATFGGGCFWCIEPIYNQLIGVKEVFPGYAGGNVKNPSYHEVCRTNTGHAEVIRIVYDDTQVNYDKLLEIFWFVHDPTSLNRQGNDVGEQYRSVIYYHDEEQERLAFAYKNKLNESGAFDAPIITEIMELTSFYPAENMHKDFYNNNPEVPYCENIIRPKVEKFKLAFSELLK